MPFGTVLTVTAIPAPSERLVTGSQAVSGTNNPTNLTVTSAGPIIGALFSGTSVLPPTIQHPPSSQNEVLGSNVSFQVTATGTGPLNYQWRKDGTNIGGVVGADYSFTSTTTNDSGLFDVIVTNAFGAVTSAPALLTIVLPPGITEQPTNLVIASGSVATLAVTATGTEPLSYQWRNDFGDLMNATNATLTLNPATTNQAGNFSVLVTNFYGALTSAPANLTVYVPVGIVTQPVDQIVPARSNAAFTVLASGFPTPGYQWLFNGDLLAGATTSSLVVSNVSTNDLGTYSVFVYNPYSSTTSQPALLSMFPSLRVPFTGETVVWGRSATLSVGAIGSGQLTYQWYKNGVPIPFATNDSFFLPTVQLSDTGLYSVVVTSALGSVTNTPAQLVVNPANISLDTYAGITIDGVAGYTYGIQYTTDLTDTNSWTPITNVTLSQPVEIWVDTTVSVHVGKRRYYRVSTQ